MKYLNLTPEQNQFLEQFINNYGDVKSSLDSLGLSLSTFFDWKEQEEFSHIYQDVFIEIRLALDESNQLLAKKRHNDLLANGHREEMVTVERKIDNKGKITQSHKKIIKKATTPPATLNLNRMQFIKALEVLVKEQVIPVPVAKKLISQSERITSEMCKAFEIDENISDVDEQKVIALIKAALFEGN